MSNRTDKIALARMPPGPGDLLERASWKLEAKLGRKPTPAEVAEEVERNQTKEA